MNEYPKAEVSRRGIFPLLVICFCFVLFFVEGPEYESARSFRNAWNLGHLFFFCLFSYLIATQWKRIAGVSFRKQGLWLLGVSLILGVLIELGQMLLDNRSPDIYDILGDLLGSLLALAFLVPSRKSISRFALRSFQTILFVVFLVSVFPLVKVLIDEGIARRQFPVLSDFETPFEVDRWRGGEMPERVNTIARHGRFSLKVRLNTSRYSGVSLNYFPGDWRSFDSLQFSLFNPSTQPLRIICRVHDIHHKDYGQVYSDRFNRSCDLHPGWNDIRIPLSDIAHAPKNRKMDLSHIRGFCIFAVRLPRPETIYVDDVRLAMKTITAFWEDPCNFNGAQFRFPDSRQGPPTANLRYPVCSNLKFFSCI